MAFRWIHKVGLAAIIDGKLLVARKRNSEVFILPGGKPEGLESDLETLAREVDEELGCSINRPYLRGVFKDVVAGAADMVVVVRLYSAELIGEPRPCSEIEELAWVDIRTTGDILLAPSIRNRIIPYLRRKARSEHQAVRQPANEVVQGLLQLV